jgi:hypothetical protein
VANIFLDLQNNAIVTASIPGTTTGSTTNAAGASVDLIDGIGNYASAMQVVGTVTGTSPTLTGKVQESTDGTTWTDVTSVADGTTVSFTQVTTSTNAQVVSFRPTKRYVRGYVTVGGTSPVFPTSITIVHQRRATPANAGGFNQNSAARSRGPQTSGIVQGTGAFGLPCPFHVYGVPMPGILPPTAYPTLPEEIKLIVAVPTYSGLIRHELASYLSGLTSRLQDHSRVGTVAVAVEVGYPADRVRNAICAKATNSGFDYVLMIDDDMHPDCEPGAPPFLPSALDFVLAHDGPCFVGAPYCAAPPHQRVLVMDWAEQYPDHPGGLGMEMRSLTRHEAAAKTGFGRAAALPTGMLLIDLRAVKARPGPWFYYEFADEQHCKLASTEDITFTRDSDWLGVPQYAAWDSWAGHVKTITVGKPRVAPIDALPKGVANALAAGWKPEPYEV